MSHDGRRWAEWSIHQRAAPSIRQHRGDRVPYLLAVATVSYPFRRSTPADAPGRSVRIRVGESDGGRYNRRVRDYAYHVVDVFTERPLEGNSLAVLPFAEEIDAATMQLYRPQRTSRRRTSARLGRKFEHFRRIGGWHDVRRRDRGGRERRADRERNAAPAMTESRRPVPSRPRQRVSSSCERPVLRIP